MYLWDLPFLIIGVLFLFRKREGLWFLLPIWLLIGIIPAGLARETPHALRIESSLPTYQIMIAYGVIQFISFFNKKRRLIVTSLLFTALFINVVYFLHGLFRHYSREYSSEWQYPYKELTRYVRDVEAQYDSIHITNELGRPYIFFLLYNKIDPENFRTNAKIFRESAGFVHVREFGKYRFLNEINSIQGGKTLYVDTPEKTPSDKKIIRKIKYLNGETALLVYE